MTEPKTDLGKAKRYLKEKFARYGLQELEVEKSYFGNTTIRITTSKRPRLNRSHLRRLNNIFALSTYPYDDNTFGTSIYFFYLEDRIVK